MSDTELQLGVSENESLAVQLSITIIGFFALILASSPIFNDEGLLISTLIVYGITAFTYWYLMRVARGAPSVLNSKGDPMTMMDVVLYVILGLPIVLVAILGYRGLDLDMRLL